MQGLDSAKIFMVIFAASIVQAVDISTTTYRFVPSIGAGRVGTFAFGVDRIFAAMDTNNAYSFNSSNNALVATFSGHTATTYRITLDAPNGVLYTGSTDRSAARWNSSTGVRLQQYSGVHTGSVGAPAPVNATRLVTYGADGSIAVWDINSGGNLQVIVAAHSANIWDAKVWSSPSGTKYLFTCGWDGTTKRWNTDTWTNDVTYAMPSDSLSVTIYRDTQLLVGGRNGNVYVFDISSGVQIATYTGRASPVRQLRILNDFLYLVYEVNYVHVIDLLNTFPQVAGSNSTSGDVLYRYITNGTDHSGSGISVDQQTFYVSSAVRLDVAEGVDFKGSST